VAGLVSDGGSPERAGHGHAGCGRAARVSTIRRRAALGERVGARPAVRMFLVDGDEEGERLRVWMTEAQGPRRGLATSSRKALEIVGCCPRFSRPIKIG
jgi:hypothetical protein